MSITLENIANLFILLDSHPHLNYYFVHCSHIPTFSLVLLFSNFCNFLLNIQTLYSYSNSFYNLCPLYMDCTLVLTLPVNLGLQQLHSSFQLPLLEQALLVPTVMKPTVSLAKLEAVTVVAIVPCCYFALELEPHCLFFLSIFPHLFYSLSNSYLNLLLSHTTD